MDMRIRSELGTVLGLCLAATPILAAPALDLPLVRKQPCTVIASFPYTITAPGNYCLSADHVTDSGAGIAIASNDVKLDCKGHSITKSIRGPWYSTGIGSEFNLSNVTIQNCRIGDFGKGIAIGGRNIRVLNNSIDGAMRDGISSGGHSAHVIGNRVTNTYSDDPDHPGGVSISVFPYDVDVVTTGQVISNNVVVGAVDGSDAGIAVYGSSAPLITGNQILELNPAGSMVISAIVLGARGNTSTTGAVVSRNSMMVRGPNVRAVNGVAALCANNVAIGLQADAFASCQAATGNTVIP